MEEALKSLNIKVLPRISKHHVGHFAGYSRRNQDISRKHPHLEIGEAANRISGHMKDKSRISWGSLGDIQGPFGGLFCELWLSWGCHISQEQSRHCHQGGCPTSDTVPQGLHGHPQHFDMLGLEHSTSLLVL